MAEQELDLSTVVATAVGRVYTQFSDYVDREDLSQEAWLWIYDHPGRVERDPDKPKLQAWRLASEVGDHLRELCRREKAAYLGYDPQDEYFYGEAQLAEYLGFLVLDEYEPPVRGGEVGGSSDPAEGNGWHVSRIDMALAWVSAPLSEQERQLLISWYVLDYSQSTLAEELGVTQQAISKRIKSATTKVIDQLGGKRPRYERDYVEERLRRRPGVRR